MSHRCGAAGVSGGRTGGRRRSIALRAGFLAVLVAALMTGSAGALKSPYTQTGSIAAYDADGQPLTVGYYDRIGGGPTAIEVGVPSSSQIVWGGDTLGPDGGTRILSFFSPIGPVCSAFMPWPFVTGPPDAQDPCWDIVWNGPFAAGTYGIVMPPSRVVGGGVQVFDRWDVTSAITTPNCRTGDMGLGDVRHPGTTNTAYAFARGPEYRIRYDVAGNVGMNASIAAHYARVSPDTSPPLVTIAPATDCKVVEQHDTTFLADFTCEEPSGLGSGVASCTGEDAGGPVANGEPLDTSTIGGHTLTVTGVDEDGNERARTMSYVGEPANDAPTALALSDTTVARQDPPGTVVGRLSTTDEDVGDSFTYTLVGGAGSANNGSFTIDGDTLETAERLSFEVTPAYAIRVRTTDSGGASFERQFEITAGHLTEPVLSSTFVPENAPVGTTVATVTWPDKPANLPDIEFALVPGAGDTDNARFSLVDAGPNVAALKTAEIFDFEAKRTHDIRISLQSSFMPQPNPRALRVHVTDVNEAPPNQVSRSAPPPPPISSPPSGPPASATPPSQQQGSARVSDPVITVQKMIGSARKLKKGRRITLTVRSSRPLTALRFQLRDANGKAVATGSLKKLNGNGKVRLKLRRAAAEGRYTMLVTAKVDGRSQRFTQAVFARR